MLSLDSLSLTLGLSCLLCSVPDVIFRRYLCVPYLDLRLPSN
jgi:hypothetical protein